jgi:hypothetical protein
VPAEAEHMILEVRLQLFGLQIVGKKLDLIEIMCFRHGKKQKLTNLERLLPSKKPKFILGGSV